MDFGSKHALIICNFHYINTIHHKVMPNIHCFQIPVHVIHLNNLDFLKRGFPLPNIFLCFHIKISSYYVASTHKSFFQNTAFIKFICTVEVFDLQRQYKKAILHFKFVFL